MTILPRILVIDDIIGADGRASYERETQRIYCRALGIHDTRLTTVGSDAVIAEAVFCSGQVSDCNSLEFVIDSFEQGWPDASGRYWTAILIDMKFGPDEEFGLRIIEMLRRRAPELPLIVVSGLDQLHLNSGESLRDAALRLGAQDFLAAPNTVHQVDDVYKASPNNLKARLDLLGLMPDPEQEIVGFSVPVCVMLRQLRTLIPSDGVGQALLTGQAGDGKSYLSGYLLRQLCAGDTRQVSQVPFRHIYLSGIANDMQSLALYGTRGVTGTKEGPGAFEDVSRRGLVVLDEIGELTTEMQGALLGPLQPLVDKSGLSYRVIARSGSSRPIESRCFVLAATNRNLGSMVRDRRFSEALLQRFDGRAVAVPPLRERKGDLPMLIPHFLAGARKRFNIPRLPSVDVPKDAWEAFADKNSIRQLQTLIETTLAKNPYKTLLTTADFFPPNTSGLEDRIDTDRHEDTSSEPSTSGKSVGQLFSSIGSWKPNPLSPQLDFEAAFVKLDALVARAKLAAWRELLRRQQESAGAVNLLETVRQLLGKDVANSKPADLAAQLLEKAGYTERPEDPLLAEIWEKRRKSAVLRHKSKAER